MTREDAVEILETARKTYPGKSVIRDAFTLALAALQPSNEPLTLEELRGMRGEPVYVVKGKCQWWDIVDFTAGGWLYLRIANKTDLALDDYGTKWLAYRRKPEVQDG